MATFKKTTLKAGDTYMSPDGPVLVTKERLKRLSDNHRILSESDVVPIAWDHADTLEGVAPVPKDKWSMSARDSIGKLVDFVLDATGDNAEITTEVTDPIAIGRADRNEVSVSPVLMPYWKTSKGQLLEDVITHMDFVVHPVDHSQGPFSRVDAGVLACSLRPLSKKLYRLSQDFKVADDDTKPDETDKPEAPKPDDNPDVFAGEKSDREKQIESILSYLPQLNPPIVLPSDTTEENIWDRLQTGLMTAVEASRKQETEETEEDVKKDDKPEQIPSPGLMAMSLEHKALLASAEKTLRDGLTERLKRLSLDGRCTPAEVTEKTPLLGAVRMSLASDGKTLETSDLEKWIADRERLPRGVFWSPEARTRMSQVVEPPANLAEEKPMTAAEAEAKAREMHGGKKVAVAQ